MTAAERVAEFLRQWHLDKHGTDDIYGVHFDVNAEMMQLTASDLQALLEENRRLKDQLSVSAYAPWKLP